MPVQRFKVAAVQKRVRQVIVAGSGQQLAVETVEVRASPTPIPALFAGAGWAALTPTGDIQFTVWGPSVGQYQPGMDFDLAIP